MKWLLLLVLAWPAYLAAHISGLETHGHREGQFYTAISIGSSRTALLLTVPREAASDLGADSPDAFAPLALSAFSISNYDAPCVISLVDQVDYTGVAAFQFEMTVTCGEPPGELFVDYHLSPDDPTHINHVEISIGMNTTYAELGGDQRELVIPVEYLAWQQSWVVPAEPALIKGKAPKLVDYFLLGFKHVLTGYDHIAFLLGLLVVVSRLQTLALLITSFTIAHSVTLAVSALDVFTINVAFTEAAIAITIIYIGAENLYYLIRRHSEPGARRRWMTTFVFGLIHGFGFSFLLREIGLPDSDFVPALLLFNLGVEAAQIAAVIAPFALIQYWLRDKIWWGTMAIAISAVILLTGSWWLLERTLL